MKKIALLSLIALTVHAANNDERLMQEIQNTDPPQGSYLFATSKYEGLLSDCHILFFIYKNEDSNAYILKVPQWEESNIPSKKTLPTSSSDVFDAEFTLFTLAEQEHTIRIHGSADLIQHEWKKVNIDTQEETPLRQESSKPLYFTDPAPGDYQ